MKLTNGEISILIGCLGASLLVIGLVWLIRRLRKDPYPYEKRPLLTDNEAQFYEVLRPAAEALDLVVLIKMRLADIMAVKSTEKEYMAAFNRIKAKHTDFVLCDPETMEVLMGIELDDKSHEQEERIERDIFVDGAYKACGIPLLHVWNPITTEELLDQIEMYL